MDFWHFAYRLEEEEFEAEEIRVNYVYLVEGTMNVVYESSQFKIFLHI